MKFYKWALVFLLGSMFVLAMSCSSDATEEPKPAPTKAAAKAPAPEPTKVPPTKAPEVEEPKGPVLGGTLRDIPRNRTFIMGQVGNEFSDVDNLNPYSSVWMAKGLHFLFESLYYLNIFDGEMTPWLAADQPEYSDDFTSVTVKLRDGITWSDGEKLTADDVVFTVNMIKEEGTFLYSANLNEWLESAEAVDDLTVKFNMTKPNPRFVLDYFGVHFFNAVRVVPEHIWKDIDDKVTFKNNDPEKGWPVGTGAFVPVKLAQTQGIFDRRDSWWAADVGFQSMPEVERVISVPLGPADRQINMAVANEIDWAETFAAGPFLTIKGQNDKWIPFEKEAPYGFVDACPFAIHVNNARESWKEPVARIALNHAIDKAKFVKLSHEGVTPTSGSAGMGLEGYGWLEPFLWPAYGDLIDFRDKNADLYEKHNTMVHDVDKANKLLDDAGYTKGSDGIRVTPSGEKMSAVIRWIPTGYVEFPAPVQSLVEDLTAIGVDASQEQVQWGPFGDSAMGEFDMQLMWVCGSTKDVYATLDGWHPKHVKPVGEKPSSYSISRWQGPTAEKFGEAVDAIGLLSPNDIAGLDPLVREAIDLWLSEMPSIPLFQYPSIRPYNSTYWSNFPTSDNAYNTPFIGWFSGNKVITNLKAVE